MELVFPFFSKIRELVTGDAKNETDVNIANSLQIFVQIRIF